MVDWDHSIRFTGDFEGAKRQEYNTERMNEEESYIYNPLNRLYLRVPWIR
jgi:hypothetical protein